VTVVSSGSLAVNGSLAAGSTVTVNNGSTLAGSGTLNGTANVNSSNVNGSNLTISGAVTFAGAGNTVAGTVNASSGVTVATGASLVVSGSLGGNVAAANSAHVSVNGNAGGSVTSGALLDGLGTITGVATVTGTASPGAAGTGIGTLTTGGLALQNNSTFSIGVTGTTAGSQYGQVISSGAVTLGSNVSLVLNTTYTPNYSLGDFSQSDEIVLTLGGYTSGTFANVNATTDPFYGNINAFFDRKGNEWAVFYGANSTGVVNSFTGLAAGNDIALLAVPEPGTWSLLIGGFGMLAFGQRLRRRTR